MEKLALTVAEACDLTGVGRTTGYRLVAEGSWPCVRIGRAVRIPLAALREWLAHAQAE